jgi:thiosulfate/3-mercaptopyruvate sulfurtransferase
MASPSTFQRFISVSDLQGLIASSKNLKILDTRTPEEFASSHLEKAVNVRECFSYLIPSTNPEGIQNLEESFLEIFSAAGIENSDDETVVVYEDGMSTGFAQSCRSYFLLTYMGHERVFVLNGGFQAWKLAGLSVSSAINPPVRAAFRANIKKHMLASRQDVLDVRIEEP